MSSSDNPDVQWALDLLTPDPNYEENFISKHYHWIVWPIVTVGGTAFVNAFQRRPIYSGVKSYAIALVTGLACAKIFRNAKYNREAERDAVLRHYIKLHPEDFPPPVRKTFNEEFREWVPLR